MALIIQASGAQRQAQPANGSDFTLAEVRAVVGDMVELVLLTDGRLMLLNEEGLLLNLSFNHTATRLYCAGRAGANVIVGDVLVCQQSEFR